MKNSYIIEYLNENEFRKKERAVKKYNMLAYKKLIFEFYPGFREGVFNGVVVSKNTNDGIVKYELKLPTDTMFAKVYEDLVLHYTVYENQNYKSYFGSHVIGYDRTIGIVPGRGRKSAGVAHTVCESAHRHGALSLVPLCPGSNAIRHGKARCGYQCQCG